MKRLLGVLGMIILGTLAISCSKDSAAPVNEDLVTYDISLNIKQDGLSTAKLDLLKKITIKKQ